MRAKPWKVPEQTMRPASANTFPLLVCSALGRLHHQRLSLPAKFARMMQTCADCLMSCDGCGSNYHCSDCMAVGGGKCVVCRPKAKDQSNGMLRTALINQGGGIKSRHIKNATSSLSHGNQMIGLPQFRPVPIQPSAWTTTHTV
jgi:hypothetical protein